jgi:hypothetical protein
MISLEGAESISLGLHLSLSPLLKVKEHFCSETKGILKYINTYNMVLEIVII